MYVYCHYAHSIQGQTTRYISRPIQVYQVYMYISSPDPMSLSVLCSSSSHRYKSTRYSFSPNPFKSIGYKSGFTLVLAIDFLPQMLEVAGDLRTMVLILCECSLSCVDNHRWWGHSSPTYCKKNQTFALSGSGDANLWALVLAALRLCQ